MKARQDWTFLILFNPLLKTLLMIKSKNLLKIVKDSAQILIHLLIHQGFWTSMKINLISLRNLEQIYFLEAILNIIAPMKMTQLLIYRALYHLKKLILGPQNTKKIKILFAKMANFPTKKWLINFLSKIHKKQKESIFISHKTIIS